MKDRIEEIREALAIIDKAEEVGRQVAVDLLAEIDSLIAENEKLKALLKKYGFNTNNKDCVDVCNCCGMGFGICLIDCELGEALKEEK